MVSSKVLVFLCIFGLIVRSTSGQTPDCGCKAGEMCPIGQCITEIKLLGRVIYIGLCIGCTKITTTSTTTPTTTPAITTTVA